MIEYKKVLSQLSDVGYVSRMWQRAEVKELCNILHEDEKILKATNGHYEGGFSLMVATNIRLLLIDKKPMFLTLDSIAYPMIQEVSFDYRLLNSTIHVYTSNKCLHFNSWNHTQIREILNYTQEQMKLSHQPQNDDKEYDTDRYMRYEHEPEVRTSKIPELSVPTAAYLNDDSLSAYVSSLPSAPEALPIEPIDLVMNSKLSDYKTSSLANRRYARRYY